MRLCRHCGERLPQEAKSCPACASKRKKKQESRKESESTVRSPKTPSLKNKAGHATAASEPSRPKPKKCPECGKEVPKGSKFCVSCGLIFFTTPAQPEKPTEPPPVEKKSSYIRKVVFFSFLFVATALGFQVFHHKPPAVSTMEQSLTVFPIDDGMFDRTFQLPADRAAVAWNGEDFVFTTKSQPTEFLRIKREGSSFHMQRIPTPDLRQRGMSVLALTWNGQTYVGYAESGLFTASKDHLFTVHDPNTLELIKTYSAPENISGLAWDGSGYWAASRVTDPESDEKAYLYRLNRDFEIVNKLKSVTRDCRGLAWDGEFLWYVDGTGKKVYVLNVKGVGTSILRLHITKMDSLGGIAFDGDSAWVIDEQTSRFYRMVQDAKLHAKETSDIPEAVAKSEDTRTPDADEYIGTMKYPSNDVEVHEFSCRVIEDQLLASWNIHAGEDLFEKPVLGTLTIVAQKTGVDRPVTKVFELKPGANRANSEIIAQNLRAGTYRIGLFLYVQYKESGANRILTRTTRTLRVTN